MCTSLVLGLRAISNIKRHIIRIFLYTVHKINLKKLYFGISYKQKSLSKTTKLQEVHSKMMRTNGKVHAFLLKTN